MICFNYDKPLPQDLTDIHSTDQNFSVYPFSNKEIITVLTIIRETNRQFGFKLFNVELYDCVYIGKMKEKSSVEKAFNKSTCDKLKGSFVTHIDDDPVFSTNDAENKLVKLYQEHLFQNQGIVGGNKNNNFSF